MPEKSVIEKTPFPQTRKSLTEDLKTLGVRKGIVLLVHSSMSTIGWISGGPVAVVQALMDVVTQEGTLVMPTHSYGYSDPEKWRNPPVPKEWVKSIKESMPAFNPVYTPTQMGKIVECFRNFPGVVRSNHPTVSFAAWGKYRNTIIETHLLDFGLGEHSPLARVYDLDGYVLLVGVSYSSNTSFHLAEYRLGIRQEISNEAPVMEHGKRVWKVYKDIDIDNSEFELMGAAFEKDTVKKGYIGLAESRLFSQRKAVDFAVEWFRNKNK